MTRQIITVDIAPEVQSDRRLKVSQYDVGRPLGVYIVRGGEPVDCSGYTAQLYVFKPDRTYYEHDCDIEPEATSLVTWETGEQETVYAGACLAEIRIMQDGVNIGTANFVEWIEESPTDLSRTSKSEVQSLMALVGQAEDAQEAAEEARGKAEDAQGAAEEAKRLAVQAAETAGGAAENAEESAGAAEQSELKAEGYAVGQQDGTDVESGSPYYQNNSKYYKEQAALSAGQAREYRDSAQRVVDGIEQAGAAQVQAVNAAGADQVTAVENKGQEVLDSIPADYTELTEEVADLNRALQDMYLSERLLIMMLNEEYSLDIPVPVDPSENISITWSGTKATVENLDNTTISWNGTIATIGG